MLDAKGGNRHERKKSLRAALVAAAGGTSPQEIAKALRAALSEEEAKSFLEAFTPLVRTGPAQAHVAALGQAVAAAVLSAHARLPQAL